MKPFEEMAHHPLAEKLVGILCQKTQNSDPLFFRILTAYHFTKIASIMRTNVKTPDRSTIPVNMYAINLGTSGHGKGHSNNIIEDHVTHLFRDRFLEETFKDAADLNMAKLANTRSIKKGNDPDDEVARAEAEFERLGPYLFSFDSATTAALKQMRHKLLMANAGAISFEIDEIGANLLSNMDVLNTYLELYDVGKVKQKLTKNTNDNTRNEDLQGKTPCNLLLFGTPSKLLNGTKIEDEFFEMLESGYARRSFFGFSKRQVKKTSMTPEEYLDLMMENNSNDELEKLSEHFYELADNRYFNKTKMLPKESALLLIEYRMNCESRVSKMPSHQEIEKAEITHRYFKVLKYAGALAFIDQTADVMPSHIEAGIKLAEESGDALKALMTRERNYVKLANYIADINKEVTHVDLVEDLPFYKGSEAAKREMMTLAIAYGYKNNIIIKRQFNDGIEFLTGEKLEKSSDKTTIIAYSEDLAKDYLPMTVKFADLHKLTQLDNYHWVNHHLKDNYRKEDNAEPGFNLVVLDVDNGTPISTAQLLLKKYKYLIHTTKSHTDTCNRYRIILPLSHELKFDAEDYKEFMNNIYEWLPFEVDTQTNQRSRKWATHNGKYFYNDGDPLDVLPFIPKTAKNEERRQQFVNYQSLSNLERWFVVNTGKGNRSNQLIRYALLLVDLGHDIDSVRNSVLALNAKIPDKLDEAEIMSTILVSASKAIHTRDTSHK